VHHVLELIAAPSSVGQGRLARIDVRVKLILALAAIVAVILSRHVALPLATAAVCLAILCCGGAPRGKTLRRLAAPLGLAAVVCLWRALMAGGEPVWAVKLGWLSLSASRQGLFEAALIGARVLGSVSAALVLCSFAQAHDIFAALCWARLPRTWVEIAMLMVRSIFTLFEQAASVLQAQKVRLGHATLGRALESAGSLAGMEQAERNHEAMVARGYQGRLPLPELPRFRRRDAAACALGVVVLAAAFILAERWFL
jgi:cobalt ECF transporter T component CbiQ